MGKDRVDIVAWAGTAVPCPYWVALKRALTFVILAFCGVVAAALKKPVLKCRY